MIADDIGRFIRTTVTSIWALELLLLMRRQADRSWTVDALTSELRSTRQLVADIVATLEQRGLVSREPTGFRYKPASDELDTLVRKLERTYAERRIALIEAIASAPKEKIQTLADAFKLKRE